MSDVLAGGRAHPRSRSAPVLGVALLVLLVAGDAQARRLEVDGLVQRVREGQSTVAFADRRLAGTVQYASPMLTSPSAQAAVRADLQALVRREAAGQVPALARRREAAARTPVAVWHRSARKARAAYVRHLDARLARLTAASQDLSTLYERPPELDERLQQARVALAAAAGEGRSRGLLGP